MGYSIRFVEKDNLGYDLVASRDDEISTSKTIGR